MRASDWINVAAAVLGLFFWIAMAWTAQRFKRENDRYEAQYARWLRDATAFSLDEALRPLRGEDGDDAHRA